MSKQPLKAVIFDLDGTLVHSLPGIAKALNQTSIDYGGPFFTEKEVRDLIGNGMYVLIERAFEGLIVNREKLNDVFQRMVFHYQRSWNYNLTLFPNIEDVMLELVEKGIPMAIHTNKEHQQAVQVVDNLFNWWNNRLIMGRQTSFPRKPNPRAALEIIKNWGISPAEILYVGDSLVDYKTASAGGFQRAIVKWGYGKKDELEPLIPEFWLNNADELRILF